MVKKRNKKKEGKVCWHGGDLLSWGDRVWASETGPFSLSLSLSLSRWVLTHTSADKIKSSAVLDRPLSDSEVAQQQRNSRSMNLLLLLLLLLRRSAVSSLPKSFLDVSQQKKINKERNPRPWNSSDRREPRVSLRHGMATQNFAFKEVEEEEQEEEESAYSSGKSRANFAVDSGRDFQTLPLPLAQLGAPQFDIRFQFQVE